MHNNNMQELCKYISQWLNHQLELSKLEGFVIGISGGIDSALTSTLCAMTAKPTLAISMPILQNPEQLRLANAHQQWLCNEFQNVQSAEIDLSSTFVQFKNQLPESITPLALANTRARLRMTCLYSFATSDKSLVVGTGNKIEDFGVGFFTKYGDGGVDISPIADLLKTKVRDLASFLGVIPEICSATPTDGLWDDERTDEQQLGCSYEELEWAMNSINSDEVKDDELTPRQREVIETYIKFHAQNKHKMVPIPVCLIPKKYKL